MFHLLGKKKSFMDDLVQGLKEMKDNPIWLLCMKMQLRFQEQIFFIYFIYEIKFNNLE